MVKDKTKLDNILFSFSLFVGLGFLVAFIHEFGHWLFLPDASISILEWSTSFGVSNPGEAFLGIVGGPLLSLIIGVVLVLVGYIIEVDLPFFLALYFSGIGVLLPLLPFPGFDGYRILNGFVTDGLTVAGDPTVFWIMNIVAAFVFVYSLASFIRISSRYGWNKFREVR